LSGLSVRTLLAIDHYLSVAALNAISIHKFIGKHFEVLSFDREDFAFDFKIIFEHFRNLTLRDRRFPLRFG
jgi:hypothetical protein